MGTYSSILYGLNPNTNYYVRAYATNASGTAYGNLLSFTTTGSVTIPSIICTPVSSITQTSAMSGGNVISNGGASVISRGVCWSMQQNPTISDLKTIDGLGNGAFNSQITGLSPYTTYFLRAYATNIVGTAYSNEITFSTQGISSLYIGQAFEGGVIFYIDSTGQHGLISASADQISGISWGCYNTQISGSFATSVGTGMINTVSIINGCGESGIAARICYNLQLNGYNDWYLPSKDELNLLYQKKEQIGNFQNSYYWSSSEYSSNEAWEQNFSTGNQLIYGKYDPISVRAIRTF